MRGGFQKRLIFCAGMVGAACAGGGVSPASAERHDDTVVARVDGQPIYRSDVERLLARQGRKPEEIAPPADARFIAAREALIVRELAFGYLQSTSLAARDAEIDTAYARLEKALGEQGRSFAESLRESGVDLASWRKEMAWNIVWKRYCDRKLTHENLKQFYKDRRAEYDSTRMKVAQILLRLPEGADAAARAAAIARLEKIREEVAAGEIDFAAAARRHSESPSAKAGGEIGWIERHYPMEEGFAAAAFALGQGETSEPVVTSAGACLIHVLDIEPGRRTLFDVLPAVRAHAERFLLKWLAEKRRPVAKIERFPDS